MLHESKNISFCESRNIVIILSTTACHRCVRWTRWE